MIIGIDFDGTVVTHEYPNIGKPIPGCIETLKELSERGHKLILWTMRSGETLAQAVEYLNKNGISLYGVNENPDQKTWTRSPKAYCQLYIDDAALGCPLVGLTSGTRPWAYWHGIREILVGRGIL